MDAIHYLLFKKDEKSCCSHPICAKQRHNKNGIEIYELFDNNISHIL